MESGNDQLSHIRYNTLESCIAHDRADGETFEDVDLEPDDPKRVD